MAQSDFYRAVADAAPAPVFSREPWNNTSRSEAYQNGQIDRGTDLYRPDSETYTQRAVPSYSVPVFGLPVHTGYVGPSVSNRGLSPIAASRPSSAQHGNGDPAVTYATYSNGTAPHVQNWADPRRYSPTDSMDMDYPMDAYDGPSSINHHNNSIMMGERNNGAPHRRPSNRDEFDGPHQFLARPSPDYIARQDRDLPILPSHLHAKEQDTVLSQVNDRLSQCAFDFMAKYQFPIPLTEDKRRVERPQDREWTEWVYLLKRLATKRRIPARVIWNQQIKQLITILENSLEMRHAAKHQSRPLKDDRNMLQLISAGTQVTKFLKDAPAMEALDRLYVQTERQIQERAARYRG